MKPQNAQPAQATEKPKSVLLRLAVQCSTDIVAVPDCRSFTENEKQEYIILKDNAPQKPQGFLLIPVQPVTGVEDEKIFSAPFIDLWSSAWLWSEKYPGKTATVTALAMNSALARTQNQLHIHISCVLPDASRSLSKKKISSDREPSNIAETWTKPFDVLDRCSSYARWRQQPFPHRADDRSNHQNRNETAGNRRRSRKKEQRILRSRHGRKSRWRGRASGSNLREQITVRWKSSTRGSLHPRR